MRARSLKPALFKNEVLGTADPLYTILFEGLWCAADRAGRLEDRPLRIKAEVLPYRENVNIEVLLSWLHNHGFIVRYETDGLRLIQIVKFLEHQSPHKNEVPSELPEIDESTSNLGCAGLLPNTASLALTPSSLTPDSGLLTPDSLAAVSTTKVVSQSTKGASVPRESPRASRSRATRLPDDFSLTPERSAYATQQRVDPQRTFENFRDYWTAASGAKARKCDWDATWRMWCRREQSGAPSGPRNGATYARSDDGAWAEAKALAKEIGFRDPHPVETASSYMLQVKRARDASPPVPISERRGLAGIKRIGAK